MTAHDTLELVYEELRNMETTPPTQRIDKLVKMVMLNLLAMEHLETIVEDTRKLIIDLYNNKKI